MNNAKLKITDLKFDLNNANRGTERGMQALETSLQKYGAGRSILVDKNGVVIAGNKTLEMAGQLGLDEIEVVQTDGKKVVAVQRMDLDLIEDQKAREMAYADNRVGQLDLDWNPESIIKDLQDGVELQSLFSDEEIEALQKKDEQVDEGMDFSEEENEKDEMHQVIIYCPGNIVSEIKAEAMKLKKKYPSLDVKQKSE